MTEQTAAAWTHWMKQVDPRANTRKVGSQFYVVCPTHQTEPVILKSTKGCKKYVEHRQKVTNGKAIAWKHIPDRELVRI